MKVSVVDYGRSNLLSVCRAIETLGHEPVLVHTADEVLKAESIILPGVGAFADGMEGLSVRGLITPILECAQRKIPMLGICLGMQMLFDYSDEFGINKGLGLIPGGVKRIPEQTTTDLKLRVPHIGWERLLPSNEESDTFISPVLRYVQPGDEVYFIHSYVPHPENEENVLAICSYGGHRLCAVTGKEMVFGTQFHPEKSGTVGLRVLKAFLQQKLIC